MNAQVRNSYLFRKEEDMEYLIDGIRRRTGRGRKGLINEWKAHNMLYYLHIFRSHTADVDFEEKPEWYVTCIWWLLSRFYFIFE